jgi:hypothetical protein
MLNIARDTNGGCILPLLLRKHVMSVSTCTEQVKYAIKDYLYLLAFGV